MKESRIIPIAGMFLAITPIWAEKTTLPGNAMFEAYSNVQYAQALKLADKHPELIEARLTMALSAVFDRRKQDLAYGLPELKRIYDDVAVKAELRLEAGLAYARAAQTLRMRPGVYPTVADIDFNKIYDEIIAGHPESPTAVFAAMYQAQGRLASTDEKEIAQGFARLEGLPATFRGPKQLLGPVHYMLADQYIIHGRRYDRAAQELEKSLTAGMVNSRTREEVTYRIARIYDVNLSNKTLAGEWYRRFLRDFPNSSYVSLARRYLSEISQLNAREVADGKIRR